jgi:citronellol/citronellal dehydrogenase
MAGARKAQVYSDAAYAILTRPAASHTGHSVLCVDVLAQSGVTDLSVYDHSATR